MGQPCRSTFLVLHNSAAQTVEAAPDLVYSRDVFDGIVGEVVGPIREHGTISVAGVRDLTGTSRKYSLAILAYLDEHRVTRRVGDDRVLY